MGGILILPIDTVGVRPETLNAIAIAFEKNPDATAVVPEFDRHPGHPVLISKRFAEHIYRLDPDDAKARLDTQLSKTDSIIYMKVDDQKILENINTIGEWVRFLEE